MKHDFTNSLKLVTINRPLTSINLYTESQLILMKTKDNIFDKIQIHVDVVFDKLTSEDYNVA